MKIKLLLSTSSFFVLLVVMALGMNGTGAWFTDQVVIENNVIQTGKVKLEITDVVKATPLLEPGGDYQEILRFCAWNKGTFNMKFRGMFTGVNASEHLADKLQVRAIINPSKEFSGNYGRSNVAWFHDKPLRELMKANEFMLLDASTGNEPFKPNDRICYAFQVRLQGSADNELAQNPFSATLQLDATQWISPEKEWDD